MAALLGAYIALFERRHETTDQARAARELLFPGLSRGDVTAIELDRGAKGRVTLVRDPSSPADSPAWRIEPGGASAAKAAVGDLLDTIDALDVDRVATAPAETAGLTAPAVRLTITAGARRFRLDAGGIDASGRGVFVRREGDARILVVGRRLRDLTDRDAGAFRDRRLFAATSIDAATALAFRAEGGALRTLRKRGGLWLDEEGTFATRAAVGEALRMLAAMQASGFPAVATATAESGSTAPRRTVETAGASTDPPTSDRLEIWGDDCAGDGGAAAKLVAYTAAATGANAHARQWICVDAGAVDRLWRQLEAANHRDPHLLVVDLPSVAGVTLSEGDRRLRLRRNDDGGWVFIEPAVTYEADAKVVGEWLASLAATTLVEGPPPASAGRSRASRHLVVEGAARTELEVAPPRAGQQSRVDRAGEVAPALVGAAAFATLDPEPLRFRARAVLALPQFDVRALEIRGPRSHLSLRREAGAEWVRQGDGAAPNASAIDHLLAILSDLRADQFVTPQPALTAFKPETTVEVEARAGDAPPQRYRLDVAAKCRARLEDTPVFTLAGKTCEDLRRTLAEIH